MDNVSFLFSEHLFSPLPQRRIGRYALTRENFSSLLHVLISIVPFLSLSLRIHVGLILHSVHFTFSLENHFSITRLQPFDPL